MKKTGCWSSEERSGKRFSCVVNYLHIDLALYIMRSPRKNVDYKKRELRPKSLG